MITVYEQFEPIYEVNIPLPRPKELDIDKIKKSLNYNIKTAKKFLRDYGIRVDFEKLGEDFAKKYNSSSDPKKVAEEFINKFKRQLKNAGLLEAKGLGLGLTEKVLTSLLMTGALIFLSSFTLSFIGSIFGGKIAYILIGALFAPIFEETAKRISVLDNYPWVFTGIFAGTEFVTYVLLYGVSPVVRVLPAIMHFLTTLIQKSTHETGLMKDDENIGKIGFVLAVLLHSTNNILAIASKGV